jgi:microcystin-dependent protein
VHSFAGDFAAYNAPPCIGQAVSAANNMQLAGIIDIAYGGDDEPNFNLPNLSGRVAAGGAPVGTVTGAALTMTYMIVAEAVAWEAFPTYGMIGLFAGNFAPSGWLVADGSSVSIEDYSGLYSMIGNSFGGDDNSFNLPDLRGRAAIGVNYGPGRAPVALGEVVEGGPGTVPALGLTYLIATLGQFPTQDGYAAFPPRQPTLGEIIAFAGPRLPVEIPGWALCDGSLLPIMKNPPLFALLRTRYGGDGVSNFALPDLRGCSLSGTAG